MREVKQKCIRVDENAMQKKKEKIGVFMEGVREGIHNNWVTFQFDYSQLQVAQWF